MNKVLIFTALIFMGAGCTGAEGVAPNTPNKAVVSPEAPVTTQVQVDTNVWQLSFDLPEGWLMTQDCLENDIRVECNFNLIDGPAPTLNFTIDPTLSYVVIQNTKLIPIFGGIAPSQDEEKYQSQGIAVIRVTRLDSSIVVPPAENFGIEDLGNGFQKVKICDDITYPECAIYGSPVYEYYLTLPDGVRYMFRASSVFPDPSTIEAIILSAKA